jgi:pimeloyl-ACP methyl ester carboxylesterase
VDNSFKVTLPDGRILGYALAGAPQGEPVFTFHGLPGSRMESLLYHEAAGKLNLLIITADRPGYGLSTPRPHRTLLQWSDDVACLADHLGIASFSIIGVSGGAPCALACGARIAPRIKKLGIVCGLGPVYRPGLTGAMRLPTAMSLWLARRSPTLLKTLVGVPVLATAKLSPLLMLNVVGLFNGGADKKLLEDAHVKKLLNLNIREAFRQGIIGAATDMQLYTQSWGFQLSDITLPVKLWHGDADKVVPLSHGQYVHNHLPDSQLTVVPGEGHFSLPIRRAEQILQHFT